MRLLSYNIHKGIGGRDRKYRLDRIIQVIEHEEPDVICLQEVDRNVRRSLYHDQPNNLAEYFECESPAYQLNVEIRKGGYGNLVLCRWPQKHHHSISLTLENRKARGAQLLILDTPSGPLRLVHWHLGLAEKERHWQVRHLLDHADFLSHRELPTIIVGDFNDWRNTLWKGPFHEHGFTQVTAPVRRFRTFPAWFPLGSLDKAFVRGPIAIRDARVCKQRLARDASDHLPLIVDFELTEPETAISAAEEAAEREELRTHGGNPTGAAPDAASAAG